VIKQISEGLHGNARETGPAATNAKSLPNARTALNAALETYLKGKLDAENGDAFVEGAARFNRWREVRSGRVVNV
jgi:hypothetical protein